MARRRRPPASPDRDPFAVLGLAASATERDVVEARRRLAKRAHPDAGGSVEQMQHLNDAADAALRAIAAPGIASGRPQRRSQRPSWSSATGSTVGSTAGSTSSQAPGHVRRDHPSFTVEALPVEAFEALLVVASWLGDLIDDDPPYALELALTEPLGGWCRLDLVPDAGASTVSVAVAGTQGQPPPSVEAVRDAFVAGLNQLDWSSLDG